jgi:hypothetical protein
MRLHEYRKGMMTQGEQRKERRSCVRLPGKPSGRSIKRVLLNTVKIPLYRRWFLSVQCRFDYPVIRGKTLVEFRKLFSERVQYSQSICNAGLIRVDDRWLSVFKNQTFTAEPSAQPAGPDGIDLGLKRLYFAELDEEWQVAYFGALQASEGGRRVSEEQGLEDARLFSFRGETWMCATMGGHQKGAWPCFGRLQRGRVDLMTPRLDVEPPQKNWMPFELDGHLYLEYTVSPRRILRYEPEAGTLTFEEGAGEEWYPGIIHGGAPAVRFSEEYFLGVANVQHLFWYQDRYYAALFYLFEARPPFRVRFATGSLRLNSGKQRVQYVTGMVFDEKKQKLMLSFGVNDFDNKIISVDVQRITRRLKEV